MLHVYMYMYYIFFGIAMIAGAASTRAKNTLSINANWKVMHIIMQPKTIALIIKTVQFEHIIFI